MNNLKTYMLAAVIITAAGFAYIKGFHRSIPSDFRDAPNDGIFSGDFNSQDIEAPAIAMPAAVPVSESVAGDDGVQFGYYIEAIKNSIFIKDGFTYPLRDCLAISANSMALKNSPNCDKNLVDKAEKTRDSILQAAAAMQRLHGDKYYKNQAGDVFPARDVQQPDAGMTGIVRIYEDIDDRNFNDTRIKALEGSPITLSVTGIIDPMWRPTVALAKGSSMEFDPFGKVSGEQNVTYETLMALGTLLTRSGIDTRTDIRHQFVKEDESLNGKPDVFRITTTYTPDTEHADKGTIMEQVVLNRDKSLDYAYELKPVWDNRKYKIALKIKDGRILSRNLDGLAGIAAHEVKQEEKKIRQRDDYYGRLDYRDSLEKQMAEDRKNGVRYPHPQHRTND